MQQETTVQATQSSQVGNGTEHQATIQES